MITSSDNEKIKTLRKLLGQKKHRHEMKQYVVECVTADRITEMKHVSHVFTSDESYEAGPIPVTQVSADIRYEPQSVGENSKLRKQKK